MNSMVRAYVFKLLTGGSLGENILISLLELISPVSLRTNYISLVIYMMGSVIWYMLAISANSCHTKKISVNLTHHYSSSPPRPITGAWRCHPHHRLVDLTSTFSRKSGELYFSVLLPLISSYVDRTLMYLNRMRCDALPIGLSTLNKYKELGKVWFLFLNPERKKKYSEGAF